MRDAALGWRLSTCARGQRSVSSVSDLSYRLRASSLQWSCGRWETGERTRGRYEWGQAMALVKALVASTHILGNQIRCQAQRLQRRDVDVSRIRPRVSDGRVLSCQACQSGLILMNTSRKVEMLEACCIDDRVRKQVLTPRNDRAQSDEDRRVSWIIYAAPSTRVYGALLTSFPEEFAPRRIFDQLMIQNWST